MIEGPYREILRFLSCPRCNESLDRAFDDVLTCQRCGGLFITPPTAGLAFEDPTWPAGAAGMWWRNAVGCPICAYHGAPTTMAAQQHEGVQIDRCATHGLWLDRGEFGRLAKTTGDELSALRRLLHGDADVDALDAEREEWKRDVEARRLAAEAENARLATERKRQIEEADRREEEIRVGEEERRYREALHRRMLAEVERDLGMVPADTPLPAMPESPGLTWREQQELEKAKADVERRESARRDDRRGEVVRSIGSLENQLIELRQQVRAVELALAAERAKLRALVERD